MRQFEDRELIDGPSVPTNAPYVLGIDLNRSESGCRRSPLALPSQPSINDTADALNGFSRRSWPHVNEESALEVGRRGPRAVGDWRGSPRMSIAARPVQDPLRP